MWNWRSPAPQPRCAARFQRGQALPSLGHRVCAGEEANGPVGPAFSPGPSGRSPNYYLIRPGLRLFRREVARKSAETLISHAPEIADRRPAQSGTKPGIQQAGEVMAGDQDRSTPDEPSARHAGHQPWNSGQDETAAAMGLAPTARTNTR